MNKSSIPCDESLMHRHLRMEAEESSIPVMDESPMYVNHESFYALSKRMSQTEERVAWLIAEAHRRQLGEVKPNSGAQKHNDSIYGGATVEDEKKDALIAKLRHTIEVLSEGDSREYYEGQIEEISAKWKQADQEAKQVSALLQCACDDRSRMSDTISELREKLEVKTSRINDLQGIVNRNVQDAARLEAIIADKNRELKLSEEARTLMAGMNNAKEADAKLGALVRQMPHGVNLFKRRNLFQTEARDGVDISEHGAKWSEKILPMMRGDD